MKSINEDLYIGKMLKFLHTPISISKEIEKEKLFYRNNSQAAFISNVSQTVGQSISKCTPDFLEKNAAFHKSSSPNHTSASTAKSPLPSKRKVLWSSMETPKNADMLMSQLDQIQFQKSISDEDDHTKQHLFHIDRLFVQR